MAKLSVLMPVYNVEEHISDALDSVLNQTFSDFELLVLDDGSTDSTPVILQRYAAIDSRIHCFTSANQKVAKCLNQLVGVATGKYVARMDGDDLCRPTRFEKQINALESDSSIGVIGSWVKTFGDADETWHYRKDDNFSKALIANGVTALCHPSWMMLRNYLLEQPYDDTYRFIIDRAWLAHFALKYPDKKIIAIPEVLLDYRVHQQSVTGQHFDKMEAKTQLLLKHYYQTLGLSLSDEALVDFCHVVYCRTVTPLEFERCKAVYRDAYNAFCSKYTDDFFAFKEKWIKFCIKNHKPAEYYRNIPADNFVFLAEQPSRAD